MPADFGVSDLIAGEYKRFIEGLSDLSDGGARAARAAAARIRPGSTAVRTISIPTWDDVIHLTPRPTITPEMRAAHYSALKQGLPSPLDPTLQDEIARRGRRARQMQSSASPEYAKAYGQVMTAIDNVQDLLTTVTTTGRFLLSGSARLLDLLGPQASVAEIEAARAAAGRAALERIAARELAGEVITRAAAREAAAVAAERAGARLLLGIGGRTIGRLVPILGPILLAADILKALNLLGMWLFPAYAALCQGPRAGAAAFAGALPFGIIGKRAGKQKVSALGRLNVFSRTARLDRSNTLRKWRPSIFNLMEVAQTTDALFGVGMVFGGLVGVVTDSAFGVEQQLRGQDVRVDTSAIAYTLHGMLAPTMREIPTKALPDYRAASNVLAHGPIFARTNATFTLEEHCDALAAQFAAWSILEPVLMSAELEPAVNLMADQWLTPPVAQYRDSRPIVLLETGAWDGEGRWPYPGSPEWVRADQMLMRGPEEIPAALLELEAHYPDSAGCALIEALASALCDRASIVLTGHDEGIKTKWRPEWNLLEALALAGRVPAPETSDAAKVDFWRACLDAMDTANTNQLSAGEFDAIAARLGVDLIHEQLAP